MIIVIFLFIGFIFPLSYHIKQKKISLPKKVKGAPKFIEKSYILSPLIAVVFGFILNLIAPFLFVFAFLSLALLLVPALLGYHSGGEIIKSVKGHSPCTSLSDEILEKDFVRQCTQVTLKGKKVMGEILLENSTGYFMHTNKAFIYFSKSLDLCVYSKYETSKKAEAERDFNFQPSAIDYICGVIDSTTTEEPNEKT